MYILLWVQSHQRGKKMNKIIFATGNENKLKEIRQIMQDMDVEIISMKEAGINIDIEETGTTFLENSYLKAKTIWDITGGIVMADDSGLVIDYLNGEPGLYSARYMGENSSMSIFIPASFIDIKKCKYIGENESC